MFLPKFTHISYGSELHTQDLNQVFSCAFCLFFTGTCFAPILSSLYTNNRYVYLIAYMDLKIQSLRIFSLGKVLIFLCFSLAANLIKKDQKTSNHKYSLIVLAQRWRLTLKDPHSWVTCLNQWNQFILRFISREHAALQMDFCVLFCSLSLCSSDDSAGVE